MDWTAKSPTQPDPERTSCPAGSPGRWWPEEERLPSCTTFAAEFDLHGTAETVCGPTRAAGGP